MARRLPDPQPYAPHARGTRYVVPCHLLGHGGLYEYVLIDTPQATRWLAADPYENCVTHPMLAQALEDLTGVVLPAPHRKLPLLGYHDDALVFQLEGYDTLQQQWAGDTARVARMVAQGAYSFGLLRRLA
jgi:hypothetical protein